MRPTDYEHMRERHHDGVCGGDCPECYVQQREENYREQERWAAYVWAREEQEREERARSQDQHFSDHSAPASAPMTRRASAADRGGGNETAP